MTVHLVGAGPGAPGLLTRRGAELLGQADVVVYDRLADRSLLAMAREGAELVDVGKRPAGAGRQADVNRLLVELGRSGRTVVRLKGGDPFLFGHGGEEVEALRAAGVPWEVVPGVTSAPVAGHGLTPDTGPLAGTSVVVTRPRDQAAPLCRAMADAGARVLELATIEPAPPEDGGSALAAAAYRAAGYQWIAFTSANAVHRFAAHLGDRRDLGRARLAAVGPATAGALARHGLVADLVPERASAEGLVEALGTASEGGRVLFPRAAAAREVLAEGLRAAGWVVDEVVAYRTIEGARPPSALADEVGRADAVVFTSPSAVRGYLASRDDAGRPLAWPPVVACIGEVTASEARRAGVAAPVVAASPTPEGLVAAIAAALAGRIPGPEGAAGTTP